MFIYLGFIWSAVSLIFRLKWHKTCLFSRDFVPKRCPFERFDCNACEKFCRG